MRILVVEDYAAVRDAIAQALVEDGYTVDTAADGLEARALLGDTEYDAVVMDVMLPGVSGLDLLVELRGAGKQTPVLLLTALDGVDDRVRGLDLGADDYLVKPFAIPELVARVRVIVRRGYGKQTPTIMVGGLSVDTSARAATYGGSTLPLTAREYALLEYLAMRVGQVVTRDEICAHIYDAPQKTSNVVDVYVGYLRKKLESGGAPRLLHTRRGEGYFLADMGGDQG